MIELFYKLGIRFLLNKLLCVFVVSGYSCIFYFSASGQKHYTKTNWRALFHPEEEEIVPVPEIPGSGNLHHIKLSMNKNLKLCIEIKFKKQMLIIKPLRNIIY